jgi:hypothetical protein
VVPAVSMLSGLELICVASTRRDWTLRDSIDSVRLIAAQLSETMPEGSSARLL